MNILFSLLNICGIGFLIFIHELGHFIFCKLFSIPVSAFAIGVGPKLLSRKMGETEYSIGIIPISGYVAIGNSDTDELNTLQKKGFIKSSAVIFGGIFFNLLFAYLAITSIFIFNLDHTLHSDLRIFAPSIVITEKEGKQHHLGKENVYTILQKKEPQINSNIITNSTFSYEENIKDTIIKRIILGINTTNMIIRATCNGILQLVTGKNISKLSGPIGIFAQMTNAVKSGFWSFLSILAIISINLALINCIPIPIFDGGRFIFLIIGKIIGKEIPEEIQNTVFYISLLFIVLLTIFSTYNDIVRFIIKT